jgi:hypothetical protein
VKRYNHTEVHAWKAQVSSASILRRSASGSSERNRHAQIFAVRTYAGFGTRGISLLLSRMKSMCITTRRANYRVSAAAA